MSRPTAICWCRQKTTRRSIRCPGNIAGAGEGAIGIAAGVGVLTKDTDAYIAKNATVVVLAQAGSPSIVANTGGFSAPAGTPDPQQTGDTQEFAASAVTYTGGTAVFNVANHGFTTGEAVIYSAESLPLGGLETGETYYVIAINADEFELAASESDAKNGIALQMASNGIASTTGHVLQTLNNTGVPPIDNQDFSDPTFTEQRQRTPDKIAQTGLIVVAVSVNDMTNAGVGVAIAGEGSGALAGSVTVNTINTEAYIDQGAKINTEADNETMAGVDQNVTVAAGRSYNDLSIGAGIAGSGGFSAAPGFAAPILDGATRSVHSGNAEQPRHGLYDRGRCARQRRGRGQCARNHSQHRFRHCAFGRRRHRRFGGRCRHEHDDDRVDFGPRPRVRGRQCRRRGQ